MRENAAQLIRKEKETSKVSFSFSDLSYLNLLESAEFARPNFEKIWKLQLDLVEQIADRRAQETVIFCEHETVITRGRRSKSENILNSAIPSFAIERGGDVTLHHPGQLVIYPLFRLHGDIFTKNLHEYLRFCEEICIRYLQSFGLDAGRYGPTGVWVKSKKAGETKKIASVGIAVRKWITYHGISLNVSNDLEEFRAIRPCDFEANIMTSLKAEGVHVSLSDAVKAIEKIIPTCLPL